MKFLRLAVSTMVMIALAHVGADAQETDKVYRVGLLHVGAPGTGILSPAIPRFFAARGYVVGKNLVLVPKAADGQLDRLPKEVEELVAEKVDVIITLGYPAALAAKQYAPGIPTVVTSSGEPVATGLAASLSHPGGNITGVSEESTALSAKRLEILKETIPGLRTVAVLWNADDAAMSLRYEAAVVEGKRLGIAIRPLGVHAPHDFEGAFSAMIAAPPDAMMMVNDALTVSNSSQVFGFAAAHHLPVIYEYSFLVHQGGLMSYGPDQGAEFERAVDLAVRILKGAKPADLPLELPTKFQLSINLKTAKALGLTIPDEVMLRADDVVE
jgi:putative tryptophan/tyrosine transport system substrate-binding protein